MVFRAFGALGIDPVWLLYAIVQWYTILFALWCFINGYLQIFHFCLDQSVIYQVTLHLLGMMWHLQAWNLWIVVKRFTKCKKQTVVELAWHIYIPQWGKSSNSRCGHDFLCDRVIVEFTCMTGLPFYHMYYIYISIYRASKYLLLYIVHILPMALTNCDAPLTEVSLNIKTIWQQRGVSSLQSVGWLIDTWHNIVPPVAEYDTSKFSKIHNILYVISGYFRSTKKFNCHIFWQIRIPQAC